VEGLIDRALFSGICEAHTGIQTFRFDIAISHELPAAHGRGKKQAILYYRYLRSRKSLTSELGGKRSIVLFFLDKDIADFCRCLARSSHVIYTEFYTCENYLFRFGDLRKALVVAACLDYASVSAIISSEQVVWAKRAATNWKEWIVFAFFCRKHKLNSPGYGVSVSQFHSGAYGNLDMAKLAAGKARLQTLLAISPSEFDQLYSRAERTVESLIAASNFDLVFNGKWYKHFLAADAAHAASTRQYQQSSLTDRLETALLATLDLSDPWTKRFHAAIDLAVRYLSQP
jgi:hypothetical protein